MGECVVTDAAKNELLKRLTNELTDRGLLIEAGWVGYRIQVIHETAPEIQLTESRKAFFAGAQHLFASMMTALDPGSEPTDADMRRMDNINAELEAFVEELKKGLS